MIQRSLCRRLAAKSNFNDAAHDNFIEFHSQHFMNFERKSRDARHARPVGDSFKYIVPNFAGGFGFDSFQGLPEDWGVVPRGTYSSRGRVPDIENSKFIVGEFGATLPEFFDSKRPKAGLINFDADLYSSTITALSNAKSVIDNRTTLVFDELIVNNNWEEDEYKALKEFCEANGFSYEVVAVSLLQSKLYAF